MNRRRKIIICLIGLAVLVIVSAPFFQLDVRAGFGDYNDYDSGSDWDSGYDSSWDDDYDSGWDWDDDYDDDYDYDYDGALDASWDGSGSYHIRSRVRMAGLVVFILYIVFILGVFRNMLRKDSRGRKKYVNNHAPKQRKTLPDRTDEISRIIAAGDPLFTAPDFIAFVKQVYMDIQSAWEKRDLEPVRGVLHQNLYQQTNRQIQKKIEDGIVNHLERISIHTAYLTSYRRDREYEYLTVYLAASMIDYQVKEATGKVILGNKTTRWNMYYKMTFMRSTSSRTRSSKEQDRGFVCPNCGAPLSGTSFGKCEYCDSIVTTGNYDWVLSGFDVVKNDTIDEGIRIS